jgi:hypothetical protein
VSDKILFLFLFCFFGFFYFLFCVYFLFYILEHIINEILLLIIIAAFLALSVLFFLPIAQSHLVKLIDAEFPWAYVLAGLGVIFHLCAKVRYFYISLNFVTIFPPEKSETHSFCQLTGVGGTALHHQGRITSHGCSHGPKVAPICIDWPNATLHVQGII